MHNRDQQNTTLPAEHASDAPKKSWHSLSLTVLPVPTHTLGGPNDGTESVLNNPTS